MKCIKKWFGLSTDVIKEVTAEEQFSGTINFWMTLMLPILKDFLIAIKEKDSKTIKILIDKAQTGLRDEALEGVEFIWSQQRIIGMEDKCFNGTILSIRDDRSMIFEHYRFLSTIMKVSYMLLNNIPTFGLKDNWNKYCEGEMTLDNCANQLEKRIKVVFDKGGIFDQVLIKVANEDYKLTK